MKKHDLIKEYLIKDEYKGWPKLKLARLIYEECSSIFPSVTAVRTAINFITGKAGMRDREYGDVRFKEVNTKSTNKYALPESDEILYEPYIIQGHAKIAVLSDVHIPYHNIVALTAAIDRMKKERIDAILLNGDILDFYSISRFVKDPRKRHFSDELNLFATFLNVLRAQFKDVPIYYKYGNHEERYDNYLFTKAKEIVGVPEFRLDALVESRAPGIRIISGKRIIKIGKLNVIHGHEYAQGIFNPVNTARGLFLRGKVTALQGHSHTTSEHTENDMNGKITTTWSTGALCELHPEYLPLNKWNHGFAIVHADRDGIGFQVKNYRIDHGRIY